MQTEKKHLSQTKSALPFHEGEEKDGNVQKPYVRNPNDDTSHIYSSVDSVRLIEPDFQKNYLLEEMIGFPPRSY